MACRRRRRSRDRSPTSSRARAPSWIAGRARRRCEWLKSSESRSRASTPRRKASASGRGPQPDCPFDRRVRDPARGPCANVRCRHGRTLRPAPRPRTSVRSPRRGRALGRRAGTRRSARTGGRRRRRGGRGERSRRDGSARFRPTSTDADLLRFAGGNVEVFSSRRFGRPPATHQAERLSERRERFVAQARTAGSQHGAAARRARPRARSRLRSGAPPIRSHPRTGPRGLWRPGPRTQRHSAP